MSGPFGLTPTGFNPMQQQDIITALQLSFQAAFGANVNLSAESINGQLIGIFSEREALLWQLAEAVYASQSPAGAEGTSVDNILALNNLQRLPASPTTTNSSPLTQPNGVVLFGLLLTGVAGTTIPAGSLITNGATPPLTFSLDNLLTIAPAANAVQLLLYSNTPTQGAMTLALSTPSGAVRVLPPYAYNVPTAQTLLTFPVSPTTGTFSLAAGAQQTAALPYNPTAAQVQTALQALTGLAATTVAGSIPTGFTITWPSASYNPWLAVGATTLSFSAAPTLGSYSLSLNGTATASLPYSATAAQVQAAIASQPAYAATQVLGTAAAGFTVLWQAATPPTVTVAANTTATTITVGSTYGLDQPATIANSIQAIVNQAIDPATLGLPYTDVVVTALTGGLSIAFGAGTAAAGAPSSGAQPQPLVLVSASTLQAGTTVTNTVVAGSVTGAPASAVGSATCTVTGPNTVKAGTLTTIATPVTGWTAVTNQLDCLAGANLETDTAALARRLTLLNAQANGPLQAIVARVSELANVTASLGFQNTTGAAQQIVLFDTTALTGSYTLMLGTQTTTSIAATATAAQVAAALAALPGLANVLVTGDNTLGFTVDFNGANGAQAQPLLVVASNTTNANLSVVYGRPPKSYEIVVQGGADADIAKAIYASGPAGIATYGAPVLRTLGTVVANASQLTAISTTNVVMGLAVTGYGLQAGTKVVSVAGNVVTLSLPAIGSYSNTSLVFNHQVQLFDANKNPQLISFSRPQAVPIYISVALVTDQYNTPGVSSSGVNTSAQFNPASVLTIQADLIAIANAVPIGGLLVALGTSGLIGAFNAVQGIVSYTLTFGTAPNPTNVNNIRLQSTQAPNAQAFNTAVSFT